MASAKEFKVIIAGGGIAGLTLANTLEKFDLDYVVLECHSEISPAVGASIGMFPNGLRILDQLGCYEPIKELFGGSIPYEKTYTRDENGQVTYDMPGFFNHLEKCAVRGVMTALGNKLEPGYFDSKEPESVPCYYCCSFGIARGVPGWTSGEQHVGTGRGRSQLVVSGPEDRVYWFMFKKLPETKYGKDIPWYSKEDEAEFVKRNWTHKPNPIGGQGANGAMESCAELMNALLRTRDSRGGHLTSLIDEEIEGIFNQTQSARHVRAVEIVKRAHDQQSLFAYENPAISTIICKFAQPLSGGESLLSLLSGAYVAGTANRPNSPRVVKKVFIGSMGLLYFVSRKAFRLPFSEIDNWSKSAMTLKWFGNTRASDIFNLFTSALAVPITDADPSAGVHLWDFLPQLISPLVIYAIEASRTGNQATPLALPLLF
ncbi:hypothetical protein CEP51_001159 [Fusarium floridanum]|uniref:FAD-binding domain-containing protein n=1 Tax=Fusarium floridanum TaxID=1325733 RepID=A0A428SIC0_9HYPO|nr:hypothetical protein CEP51_001159 [Fusarium floridanum]